MEDLRIYDFEFNLLAIEHKVISSSWELYYNGFGKAEIHIPRRSDAVGVLFDNKFLFITQGKKQAIVTAKQIATDCVIFGKTPDWFMSRRAIECISDTKETNVEDRIRSLVEGAFSDCGSQFVSGEKTGAEGMITLITEKVMPLSDIVTNTLQKFGLGRKIHIDLENKRWVFAVYKGKELPLVLSQSAKNAYDEEYIFDMQNYFTEGIYKKEEEDKVSYPVVKKEEKSGFYRWETVFYSDDENENLSEINKLRMEESLTAQAKGLIFGSDYNLGDTVTFSIDAQGLKRRKKYKIVGVSLWCEADDFGERPIFEEV